MKVLQRVLFLLLLVLLTNAQWVAIHSRLPTYNKIHPKTFNISIGWRGVEGVTNVTLNLVQNDAVSRKLPIYNNNKEGRPVQTRLLDLKHTAFYHDLANQASVSLTSFDSEDYSMKGSFAVGNEKYDLAPYSPKVHKRSLHAVKGDHVVELRQPEPSIEAFDYKLPDKTSPEYARLMRSWAKVKEMEAKKTTEGKRKKRQTLPDVTYTIQLYMVIDYYAYNTLVDLAADLDWPNDDDDFVAFYMGHQASEIDTRYRNIDSSVSPVSASWTMGTKLSFLHVAKTTSDSSWTYPPSDASNLYMDAGDGLDAINDWTNAKSDLPSGADHVMLITSLDIYSSGSLSTAGLAWVGGACDNYKTSINELGSTTVYAHELGHNMGASHDGSSNSCSADDDYVMAPSSGRTTEDTRGHPWYFSTCSVEYFDAYLTELGSEVSCLENSGSYVDTWADDYLSYLGQVITVDHQCALEHGDGYYFATSRFDEVCHSLWCGTGSGSIYSGSAALRYTSCGDKKWCVDEECVYDANAPELDESCPFGDGVGAVFSNSDKECADLSQFNCGSSTYAQSFCCVTCPTLATPWLGPNCPYGDTANGCEGLDAANCAVNPEVCCDSCCEENGPDEGYSCEPQSTTTAPITTSTTTPTTTSTTPITTSTTLTTTTTTPTTTTSTTTTTTSTSTTTTPTTTTSTTTSTSSTTSTTSTTSSTSTTSTTSVTTPTSAASTTTKQYTRGFRTRRFRLIIRITGFSSGSFDCNDAALQDSTSPRFLQFQALVCVSFGRYVKKITICIISGVSCGSIIANSTVAVEENDGDDAAEAAPASEEEFLQQISGIVNDTDLVVPAQPIVEDLDECEDATLNDCDVNAECTNTDGYYTCACDGGYDDVSTYVDEPGRTCTPICDEYCSGAGLPLPNSILAFLPALMLAFLQGFLP